MFIEQKELYGCYQPNKLLVCEALGLSHTGKSCGDISHKLKCKYLLSLTKVV